MSFSIFKSSNASSGTAMRVVDHLEDLRKCLFRALIAIAAGATIVGVYNKVFIKGILMGPTHSNFPTYRLLCKIGSALHLNNLCIKLDIVKMQSIGVSAQFNMFFSSILIGGIIIAFPYIFMQFWNFVKPALTHQEQQKTRGVIFWVSILFFLGVLFGYFVIAPYTISFFAHFTIDDNIENRWTISSYIGTLIPLILGAGLAFQLPVAMVFLSKASLVTSTFLKKKRKYAMVVMLIVAGVITPPDVLSQVIVTVPLMLLYEASIILVKRLEKRKKVEDDNNLLAAA